MCVYIYIYTHTHKQTHTHNGKLLSSKRKEILPFTITWMSLEGIMLSEISQKKTDTVRSYMWNLKNQTHKNGVDGLVVAADTGWGDG